MAQEEAKRDQNRVTVIEGVTNDSDLYPTMLRVDPSTLRLLVNTTITGTSDFNLKQVGGSDFALGQQLAAASLPVVLTAAQIATLTPLSTVTANLSATDNAVLDNIDTNTSRLSISGIGHGVKTVTSAGTDVVLATSTACKKVDIQAMDTNTGLIAVGASGVDATSGSGTGVILNAGDVYSLEIDNLADIYIDATVSGEKARYTYYT